MISPLGWIPEGLTCSEGFRWGGGLSTRNPLHFCQHSTGLFAGGAVDVVVAEEDLRGGGVGGAVFGHVVDVDVDGGIVGSSTSLMPEAFPWARETPLDCPSVASITRKMPPLSARAWSSLKVKVSPW